MPYDYFVRITHPYVSVASLLGTWALRCEKLLAYEHVGTKTEKVHIHILIMGSALQKKQLRNIGQQYADLKGNELCSFKECITWEQPVVYMTKGNLEPVYNKGFETKELAELKAKWVEPKKYEKKSANQTLYEGWECSDWKQLANKLANDEAEWRKRYESADRFGQDSMIVNDIYCAFDTVREYFRQYIFDQNHHIWDQQAVNKYKMMVMTYCFRNHISIPKNEWSKWT